MATNNIDRVRAHLFDVLDGLTDKEQPMAIDRAKAICEAAQTLINSAKVEVDFLKVTGGDGGKFLQPAEPTKDLPDGITRIVQHRLRG